MAVSRDQKKVLLQELEAKFDAAQSVIFTNYIGLKVGEVGELRRKLRQGGAEMKVAKKTLMQIAARKKGLPELDETMLSGAVACIFSTQDPVVGAQIAFGFAKDHPQVSFVGGIFEGKLLSKSQAMTLATIPGRQALLGTFAGMLRSPLVSFASMCSSPLSGFARALKELEKKGGLHKDAAAPAAA